MAQDNNDTCKKVCQAIAAAAGLVALWLLWSAGAVVAVGFAVVFSLIVVRVLTRNLCPSSSESSAPKVVESAPVEAKPEPAEPTPVVEAEVATEETKAETSGFTIRSSQLPGQEELAARKGTWKYGN